MRKMVCKTLRICSLVNKPGDKICSRFSFWVLWLYCLMKQKYLKFLVLSLLVLWSIISN